MPDSQPLLVRTDDGTRLAGEVTGAGPAIVLLHGLTATRRYVVMGSRLLERSGYRVIAYDARGHGRSTPAPEPSAYGYGRLARDLEAVLDALELGRAVVAGASMGAHTALRFALDRPGRVAALALVTPSFDPSVPARAGPEQMDALAHGLRDEGVEGFVRAYDFSAVPPQWRDTVETVIRQRLGAQEHPDALADAIEVVPRSRPFARLDELARIQAPTLVVATRDEADPGHPLAVAESYTEAIPGARIAVEPAGPPAQSPIAWQGGRLSKLLVDLLQRV
jgi:pimeloyl-ACP methyl ester carboxylesterase